MIIPLNASSSSGPTSACARRLALLNYVKFIMLDPQVTAIAVSLHWAQLPIWISEDAVELLDNMTCEDR